VPNTIPIDKLDKIVGKENLKVQSGRVFISPENSSTVSEIVKLANRNKFKILPSGSGSIVDPSRLNTDNLVILKSDKINRVVKVVPQDLYVILQAGFPLKELNRHLESYNLFSPLADGNSAGTMGGAAATNLKGKSGERSIQTREYVLAVEVINPEGQILNVGARTFKSVTGYDLPRLFVGSWGTLGFISEISLRLVPARKRKEYPSFIPNHPNRSKKQDKNDLKTEVSSRIKKSLDPNEIFFQFNSLP
jgi:glycolate oxidase